MKCVIVAVALILCASEVLSLGLPGPAAGGVAAPPAIPDFVLSMMKVLMKKRMDDCMMSIATKGYSDPKDVEKIESQKSTLELLGASTTDEEDALLEICQGMVKPAVPETPLAK